MSRTSTDAAPATWRLLVDGPRDGAANMAVDEALLDGYLRPGGADRPPTLRLYGWRPATLSLGRSQDAERSHDAEVLRSEGVGLVRRPTGGQAVLHEFERTYSVTGRLDRPPFDGGVLRTYRAITGALLTALRRLGVEATATGGREKGPPGPVCFNASSSWEPTVDGRKLIGSAQMRRREAFLQHGSIPLAADPQRWSRCIGAPADPQRFAALAQIAGRRPSNDEVDAAIVEGFRQAFGIEFEAGALDAAESERVELLRGWKYLSERWTLHGRVGGEERRLVPGLA